MEKKAHRGRLWKSFGSEQILRGMWEYFTLDGKSTKDSRGHCWRKQEGIFVLASTSCTPPVAMLLLSVVAVSVSRGYPPNVVLQRETCCNGGQTYDKVTPPIPSTGAMIRRKKSVLFLGISSATPKRTMSSFATFL